VSSSGHSDPEAASGAASAGEAEAAAPPTGDAAPVTMGETPKPPAQPAAPAGSIKRGAALRRELVAKLPKLAVAGDSAGATSVDPHAADLDADAFIGPLHALVSEGRG
jgi:hypothetical protein